MLVADYAAVDQNTPPDFRAFHDYGGTCVIVRGAFTFRGQAFADPMVSRDRDAIYEAGLQFGAYLIHGWTVDPAVQVRRFVQTVGEMRPGDLPVFIDAESSGSLSTTFGITPGQAIARLEQTYQLLAASYPTVGVYCSDRWWKEILNDAPSIALGRRPLWIKIPYPWNPRNPPHLEERGVVGELPAPWRADTSGPGVWLKQFQGDAVRVPGFSATVDLSEWINFHADDPDERGPWISTQLSRLGFPAPADLAGSVRQLQLAHGLEVDGVIGPATFAALCS